MDGLYTIVEFADDDKWFIVAEKEIENIKYSYLIRVNAQEDDFIDEFQVVRSYFKNDEEYMDTVTDKELLKKIMPILVPESAEYANSEQLKELLRGVSQ